MNSLLLSLGCLVAAQDPPTPSPGAVLAAPTRTAQLPPSTQQWNSLCEQRGLCAAADNQSFGKMPRVCPVAVCPCDTAKTDAGCPPEEPMTWEFHDAARVELQRFDPNGELLPANGLVIYEGMRFRASPTTGIYELAFTATVPEMPVTLRLQLLFKNPTRPDQVMRLTMPPIRMEPKKDARPGDPSASTFHISHRGYSTLFIKRPVDELSWPVIDRPWKLERIGTARFGSPVANDDPTR